MKKAWILMGLLSMILSIGCAPITVSTGEADVANQVDLTNPDVHPFPPKYNKDDASQAFEDIKKELQLIPQKYNIEEADEGGYMVISNGRVVSRGGLMDRFISDCESQTPATLTLVSYDQAYGPDGNPVITKILYNGFKYYAIEDDSRLKSEDAAYHEFQFDHLKVFEEPPHKMVVMVNDSNIDYEQLMKSLVSSNSKASIDMHILCSYED